MRIDPLWFSLIADLLVNLSSGWLAAVIIVPFASTESFTMKRTALTLNLLLGILSLVMAFYLRNAEGL